MFIGLEGVDGSGKSSLADEIVRQIQEKYPYDTVTYLHSGPLKKDPIEEYVFSIQDYEPGNGHHIVADRWHYGEQVYGPLYRSKSAISTAAWRWIELWLCSRAAAMFVVTNELDIIKNRLATRGEDFLKDEDVEHVLDAFGGFCDSPTYQATLHVDENHPIELTARMCINTAERLEQTSSEMLHWTESYVGSMYPSIILVGDKRGGTPPYQTKGAFYPVAGNSATFLWEAISEVDWQTMATVNINEEDCFPLLLGELQDVIKSPIIVALGQEAHKRLRDLGIDHGVVPHPQYVRRFHNAKQVEYGALILEAASTGKDLSKWPK